MRDKTAEGASVIIQELARKGLHLLIAFVPLIALSSRLAAVVLLCAGALYYLFSELVRLKYHGDSSIPLVLTTVVRRLTVLSSRKYEGNTIVKSPLTLAAGAILSLLFFEGQVLEIAICALAFGDTAAALVGKTVPVAHIFGLPEKTVGGTTACFAASFFTIWIVTGTWGIALICGAAAAAFEFIPLKDYDNICVPLGTGFIALLLL
ncbi:MAG: diacylglycerol/polyprenol kinase family protein [Spirochaetota bacterium]